MIEECLWTSEHQRYLLNYDIVLQGKCQLGIKKLK